MFTIRNMGGVALFLFGTTFLWLTPAFATQGVSTKGVAWSVTQVLALLTLALFAVATWGLFTKAGWWGPLAIVAAVLGFVVLGPYWRGARHAGGGTARAARASSTRGSPPWSTCPAASACWSCCWCRRWSSG